MKATTLCRNLRKMSLTCWGRDTLWTHVVHGHAFRIKTWHSPPIYRAPHIRHLFTSAQFDPRNQNQGFSTCIKLWLISCHGYVILTWILSSILFPLNLKKWRRNTQWQRPEMQQKLLYTLHKIKTVCPNYTHYDIISSIWIDWLIVIKHQVRNGTGGLMS